MAQTEYKGRHDKLAKVHVIHWESKWLQNGTTMFRRKLKVKILWEFIIQTDHVTEQRHPDVVVLDKRKKMRHLIDIAVSGDIRVASKETEKIQKYQDLARELRKICQV